MHRGRILGVIVGLVILATLFLVDFSNSKSLYATAGPLLQNVSGVSALGSTGQVTYDYLIMACFIILVIAGVVGFFPLGSGVLGIVAMAVLTVGAFLTLTSAQQPSYDTGFYLLWVESVIILAASFWHRRDQKVVVEAGQAPATPGPAPQTS